MPSANHNNIWKKLICHSNTLELRVQRPLRWARVEEDRARTGVGVGVKSSEQCGGGWTRGMGAAHSFAWAARCRRATLRRRTARPPAMRARTCRMRRRRARVASLRRARISRVSLPRAHASRAVAARTCRPPPQGAPAAVQQRGECEGEGAGHVAAPALALGPADPRPPSREAAPPERLDVDRRRAMFNCSVVMRLTKISSLQWCSVASL
jgi:hypothetical protein